MYKAVILKHFLFLKSRKQGIEDLFQTAGTMDILTAYKKCNIFILKSPF